MQIAKVRHVSLYGTYIFSHRFDRRSQLLLTTPRYKHVGALVHKLLGRRKPDAAIATSNECNFSFEFTRVFCVTFHLFGVHCLLRYPASIDDQRGPDGELCVVGTEIQNSSGDLFGDARSPDRNHRCNLIAHGTFSETIEHFSGDDSRRDGVDADVSSDEFESDRFGQAFDSMLRSNVNADLSQTNVPRHAGVVDDGAASVLEHGGNFVTHRIENAPNVDIENASILSFGSLIQRAFPFNARI